MKKLFIYTNLLICLTALQSNAQFVDALTSETTLITSVAPAHTGNDILDD